MKFDLKSDVLIVQLGAGGTGGFIARDLYRMLSALNRKAVYILADGDRVEEKNLVRQNFIPADLNENKARCTASRYGSAFGQTAEYLPDYVEDRDSLCKLLSPEWLTQTLNCKQKEPVRILIGAVDNSATRAICHEVFQSLTPLVYIDSGNDDNSGQVVCGVRNNKRILYQPAGSLYPKLIQEKDKLPSQLSCAEAALSQPQTMQANLMAAVSVLGFLSKILVEGELDIKSVTFSTSSIAIHADTSVRRKEQMKQAARLKAV